jgi:hypothetical protein
MQLLPEQEQKDPLSNSRNKHSPRREYRLEISKLTESMPAGEFIAYCVVSKESTMGLFVHERLLVLNTATCHLSYYSELPHLPLSHPLEIGQPK